MKSNIKLNSCVYKESDVILEVRRKNENHKSLQIHIRLMIDSKTNEKPKEKNDEKKNAKNKQEEENEKNISKVNLVECS